MITELELQHRSELADAKLEVAEDMAWAIAILAAISTHLKWESWLLTILVAGASYFFVVFRYQKQAAKAEDEYFRLAGLGKYAGQQRKDGT